MVSALRAGKYEGEIKRWDTDGDGVIEKEDFALAGDRLTQLTGASGAKAQQIKDAFGGVWQAWWAPADRDGDGRVSAEEFMQATEWLESLPRDQALSAAADVIGAMFDALDRDDDGMIEADEYKAFVDAAHGDTAGADRAWSMMDSNNDGMISRDEFVTHLSDYYTSDDPGAVGNWIFGQEFTG
jgi:EF-hand domain pair/EF hand